MKNITKKVLSIFSSVALVLSSLVIFVTASPALAQTTLLVGNDAIARTQLDTASGFAVVDINHPATAVGSINQFQYFASNTNPFMFVLVDSSNVVQWVSPMITPIAVGVNTYSPTSLVPIQSGWNLGVFFSSTGTIPFEATGVAASWTAADSSVPTTGSTLSFAGSGARVYSFVGNSLPTLTNVTVTPTTETLSVGGVQQLTTNPMDQNSTAFSGATLNYMSSNTSVATVSSSGLITAVSAGTATITVTATSGSVNVTATSAVTVSESSTTGTSMVGNDTTAKSQIDSSSNFTIIDTNHPVSSSGSLTQLSYNASNMNPFMFVLVDSSNVVQWVSPMITPAATGVNTFTPTSPVPVQAGWNLGVYFSTAGTISFDSTGAAASWTTEGSGAPTTNMTLSIAGSGPRTYAFMGIGTSGTTTTPILTSVTVTPTTKTLNVGETQQLTASPMDQSSTAFSGATINYSSNNTAVATVSASGLVTAVSAGSATITASANLGSVTVSATSVVTVNAETTTPPPFIPPPVNNPNVSFYIGNDALTIRNQVDTASNFTVVDTNHSATGSGNIFEFDYYASNMNPFEFVVVDQSNVVQWISPTITPSVIGFNAYKPSGLVPVQTGWNIGVHFNSTGTIPYENTGANAFWTANVSGMPATGTALIIADSGSRTYSFVAAVKNGNNENGNGNNNAAGKLRITILLDMIKRLLAQLGITESFTSSSGLTF